MSLYLPRGSETPYPDRLPQDVAIKRLKGNRKVNTAIEVAKILKREQPDAVLAAKDHAIKASIVARYLSGKRIPVYIKLTNHQSAVLRRFVKRKFAKLIYPKADLAIAISRGVAADYTKHFHVSPEKVCTIYNPSLPSDFHERSLSHPGHEWFGDQTCDVVVAAGRLTEQKGFDVLLESFEKVSQKRRVRLIILGDGPERESLKKKAELIGIAPLVELVGFVSDPAPWMAHASLFVLSSRYEGLGNVLVEALAAGAPVVSTDCPSGPREILEDGKLGPLVPVDDVDALAEAMERTLNRPPPADERERSLERFRSGPVARQYLETMGLREPAADAPDKPHEGDPT